MRPRRFHVAIINYVCFYIFMIIIWHSCCTTTPQLKVHLGACAPPQNKGTFLFSYRWVAAWRPLYERQHHHYNRQRGALQCSLEEL